MENKVGRNDPCPCGSGKKYKQCCWGKGPLKRKLSAKWLNSPLVKEAPDLFERTFKEALDKGELPPVPPGFEQLKSQGKKGSETKDDKAVE